MADVVFIIVVLAFVALCAALVVGCDRIVRSGEDGSEPAPSPESAPSPEEVSS